MRNQEKAAILFVGHGSRDVEAIAEFNRLAGHFRKRFPDRLYATGFLEFARPMIAEGIDELMARGARQVLAIPGMLMAAGHVKNDIPSELNTLQAQREGLTIAYGTDLGIHAKLLQVARIRIEEAEAQFGAGYDVVRQRQETLLVVVGRGASDSDANSNISKIARMLEEGMGFRWSATCFSGVTAPLVPEALERVHRLGFKRVIVFPYFLFTGRLVKRIYRWTDEYATAHPDIEVVKAPYLNDHPLVIETFVEKQREIELGIASMNCQLCQYRVQVVGSEHKVGEPQQSHHHHVRGIGTDHDHHAGHHHDHAHHGSG